MKKYIPLLEKKLPLSDVMNFVIELIAPFINGGVICLTNIASASKHSVFCNDCILGQDSLSK